MKKYFVMVNMGREGNGKIYPVIYTEQEAARRFQDLRTLGNKNIYYIPAEAAAGLASDEQAQTIHDLARERAWEDETAGTPEQTGRRGA